jgi:hypothetical protein
MHILRLFTKTDIMKRMFRVAHHLLQLYDMRIMYCAHLLLYQPAVIKTFLIGVHQETMASNSFRM